MGEVVGLQLGCGDNSRLAAITILWQLEGGYYSRAATIGQWRLIKEIHYMLCICMSRSKVIVNARVQSLGHLPPDKLKGRKELAALERNETELEERLNRRDSKRGRTPCLTKALTALGHEYGKVVEALAKQCYTLLV